MTCTDHKPGTNSLLVGSGGQFGDSAIYDVSDPITPHLLCRVQHSSAQLSGPLNFQYLDPRQDGSTDVVNHFQDGSEARNFVLAATVNTAAWASTGALAYTVPLNSYGSCPVGATQVWTYQSGASTLLYTYCDGFGDCICRFGLPAPVLAISPDGQYLVSGWLAGKGSEPMAVYRLADRVRVATLPSEVARAFWDVAADRLFLVSISGGTVWSWSELGITSVNEAAGWRYYANISPDGRYVVYTDWADAQQTQARVYLFDLNSKTTRMLIDKPRSQAVFIRKDWVWYLEEKACADCPNGTQPTGIVFAMNVNTGVEQLVGFPAGEDLMAANASLLSPGQWWPNS